MQARLTSLQQKLDVKKSATKKRKQEEGGEEKEAKSKQKYKKKSERPEWFNHKPAPGKIHETKKWDNIGWHYCCDEKGSHCGGIWRKHDPKKCRFNTTKKYSKKRTKRRSPSRRPSLMMNSYEATFPIDGDGSHRHG